MEIVFRKLGITYRPVLDGKITKKLGSEFLEIILDKDLCLGGTEGTGEICCEEEDKTYCSGVIE